MARNWAITIGINRYRYLPPLKYGMSDADAVRQFFVQELGFEQVYHFTDQSLPIVQDYGPELDSRPTGTTLSRFLRKRFEQPFLKTGDNLWFFFAGHGIRYENRDYLMPIDGDRDDLERSAIPLHYVSERLQRCGADNVILLIDACRNGEGRRDVASFGEEKQKGVVTLYSCSPEEASYEIEEIGGGAFTRVLLESLRLQGEGNCATVERLYKRLRYYVPQLTRSYRRGAQTPYGRVEPPSKNHLILLPRQATLTDVVTLKNDALRAEVEQDFELARHFWIRVLFVAPGDSEAISGIERLSREGCSAQASANTSAKDSAQSRSAIPFSPWLLFPRWSVRSSKLSRSRFPENKSRQKSSASRRQPQSNRAVPGGFKSSFTRRQLLQVGLAGGGLGMVFSLGRELSKVAGNSATPSSSSTSLSAADLTPTEFETVKVNTTGEITSRETLSGRVFKESIDDTLIELMYIPGGSFQMGSPEGEGPDDERPQHEVTVPSFMMGRYQVTQAQWRAVAALPEVERSLEADPSNFKGDNRPVERVSWEDAVEFCRRLTQYSGREYRLPSEAEWEYACRAGTTTPFHFGETLTSEIANYDATLTFGDGPEGVYREETTEVGNFLANAFGLHDIHGNVWEWCQDHWHENYDGAPSDGSAWITGGDASQRLLRGGSWDDLPRFCRSAYRLNLTPDNANYIIGFRVSCSAPRTLT
ncbi:MAG: SUMF1/EgtB/PvdO family nonheme iron enzyme [Cyanobacteria bacterium J06632_3]